MTDETPSLWRLEGAHYSIHILCPKIFAAVLSQTLTGWRISSAQEAVAPEIAVKFHGEAFLVDSLVLTETQTRADIVDALNEFFLSLVYYLCHLTPDAVLLHCAAFYEDDQSNIVIGKKKRGKSSLTYSKAEQGVKILADDLLLWHPKRAEFTCLGLPIRMRRPVLSLDGKPPNPENFLTGAYIAYSKIGAYNIAPMGEKFLVDTVLELGEDFKSHPVPLLKIPKRLKNFKIGDQHTSLKKDKIKG